MNLLNEELFTCEVKNCHQPAKYANSKLVDDGLGFTKESWDRLVQTEELFFVCEKHKGRLNE